MSAFPARIPASPALADAFAAIDLDAARRSADWPKRIARKVLRGLSGRREGPWVKPLTAARASDPNPAAGIARLAKLADAELRHASLGDRAQFRAAMICLRWRRRHERGPRLVVDNTTASVAIGRA